MKKLLYIVFLSIAVGVAGCKKDYFNLDENPNLPSVSTPGLLLTGALKGTAQIINTNFSTYGVWVSHYTPSGNYVPNASLFTYNFTNADYQVWAPLYLNAGNYDVIEKNSTGDPKLANFKAIASIMKAYDFQALVDIYNNVPYSQAFKGIDNISPAYDKGEMIYDDLVKKLDSAIVTIKTADVTAQKPGTSDIMFQGNMTKWIKFANTLKLRLLLRQWNLTAKRPALIAAGAATEAEGYIDESASGEVNPGYANSDSKNGQQSPYWANFGFDQSNNATSNHEYFRANTYTIDKLNSYKDPRVRRLYDSLPDGTVKGNFFGDPNARSNATTSAIGPGLLKSATQNAVILSASESLFLQAEAKVVGVLSGGVAGAKDVYERGITASFVVLGVPDAVNAAKSYYQSDEPKANVNFTASAGKEVEAIITQKWIALTGYNSLEAYNEQRRTGFPSDLPLSKAAGVLGSTLPSRIFYPSSEYQQNAANVAKEGTIDRFTSKIFWAK